MSFCFKQTSSPLQPYLLTRCLSEHINYSDMFSYLSPWCLLLHFNDRNFSNVWKYTFGLYINRVQCICWHWTSIGTINNRTWRLGKYGITTSLCRNMHVYQLSHHKMYATQQMHYHFSWPRRSSIRKLWSCFCISEFPKHSIYIYMQKGSCKNHLKWWKLKIEGTYTTFVEHISMV